VSDRDAMEKVLNGVTHLIMDTRDRDELVLLIVHVERWREMLSKLLRDNELLYSMELDRDKLAMLETLDEIQRWDGFLTDG
jgi:hypothetical protein